MADLNLPILDLSQLDAGPEAAARFRDDLRAATHDVGFFYLTGTGVSPELEARLHQAARDFFALPEADKLAIENVKSPHFRGYTRIGGERTQGKVDWREQIDIGPSARPSPTRTRRTSPASSDPTCGRTPSPSCATSSRSGTTTSPVSPASCCARGRSRSARRRTTSTSTSASPRPSSRSSATPARRTRRRSRASAPTRIPGC